MAATGIGCLSESLLVAPAGTADPARRTSSPLAAGDLFDGSLLIGDEGGEMWEVESASQGGKLLVEWGAEGDDFDAATQARAPHACRARDRQLLARIALHAWGACAAPGLCFSQLPAVGACA